MTRPAATGRSALGRWSDRVMRGLGAALLAERSRCYEIVFGVSAIGISTAIRLAVEDVLPEGFPFLTYFPAVLLTLVYASRRAGVAVAVICGLIAWVLFIDPAGRLAVTPGSAVALTLYALIIVTDIVFLTATGRALRRHAAAERRANALAHARSLMFSELQHRISNNLATVAALLRLQAQSVTDETARQALVASQTRIRSISLLQRRLHAPDMQELDAADYLREVLTDVVEVAGAGNVDLQMRADPLPLPHDTAVPLGLIASELAMNAIEHGQPATGGPIRLGVDLSVCPAAADGRISATLCIADRGPGLPPGFDLEACDSLGLSVARQFATALDGTLTLSTPDTGGTVARLAFAVTPQARAEAEFPTIK